jgi:DNA-binding CsgD family transcriptional regulator
MVSSIAPRPVSSNLSSKAALAAIAASSNSSTPDPSTTESAAFDLSSTDNCLSENFSRLLLLQAVVEGLIDGVLLVSSQGDVLQSNSCARRICQQLQHASSYQEFQSQPKLPAEIWRVCAALRESRELFPNEKIIPESEITVDGLTVRIRAQWLFVQPGIKSTGDQDACILVTLEDQDQTLQNRAIADMQKFGLTPREGQIWALRLQGYSYQEITAKLFITENTVKKHIKSILSKRRIALEIEED